MRAIALLTLLAPSLALADDTPCADSLIDPIVTPLRDTTLDAQRSACMRDEHHGGLRASALIDTPGFRGVLGGELNLGTRFIVRKAHELSVGLTLFDYTFAQNAVNKVSHTGFGPLTIGAAAGGSIGTGAQAALSLRLELPFTHERTETFQTSAQLLGIVTGSLTQRLVLHARLGTIVRVTSSDGGETARLGLVAGADLVWHLRTRLALMVGTEVQGGWDAAVDHVLLRAGIHWRVRGGAWRLRTGAGIPVAGDDRTNAILDVTLLVDR